MFEDPPDDTASQVINYNETIRKENVSMPPSPASDKNLSAIAQNASEQHMNESLSSGENTTTLYSPVTSAMPRHPDTTNTSFHTEEGRLLMYVFSKL